MASSFASRIVKDIIKNEFAQVAEDGILGGDVSWYVDTGSYAMNALISGSIYGGFPNNNVTAIAGKHACGKTYYAIEACKRFQDDNPDGVVLYFESEGAIRNEMLDAKGIDKSRFIIMPVVTVEKFRKQLVDLIKAYDPKKDPRVFVVLDSLGNLSTEKEVRDIVDDTGKRDMTRAQLIKATFRVITLESSQKGIPLLLTNHTYTEQGGSLYPKEVLSGGSGISYASSSIIFLSKSKEKDGTQQVGVKVRAILPKSRLTIENSQVYTKIHFKKGLDRYFGLLDIAIEGGIVKKDKTRVVWTDGSKHYEKTIYENPEKFFTKDILDKIDVFCKEKFTYTATSTPLEIAEEETNESEDKE